MDNHEFLVILRRTLVARLSKSDVRDICFDMKVSYDDIDGDTISDKVRGLIIWCDQRNKVFELVNIGRVLRPDISWDDILVPTPNSITSDGIVRDRPVSRPQAFSAFRTNPQLDDLFAEATRKWIQGDLGHALQIFKSIQKLDESHPRIESVINAIEDEMRRGYIDHLGRIDNSMINSYFNVHRSGRSFGLFSREDMFRMAILAVERSEVSSIIAGSQILVGRPFYLRGHELPATLKDLFGYIFRQQQRKQFNPPTDDWIDNVIRSRYPNIPGVLFEENKQRYTLFFEKIWASFVVDEVDGFGELQAFRLSDKSMFVFEQKQLLNIAEVFQRIDYILEQNIGHHISGS